MVAAGGGGAGAAGAFGQGWVAAEAGGGPGQDRAYQGAKAWLYDLYQAEAAGGDVRLW